MSSPDMSKSLETKLKELESKAEAIEKLATKVKENEKKLYDLANSTMSYISQLKGKHKNNDLSSVALADKLEGLMEKIEKDLGKEPSKESIDKTIDDLQKILQSSKSTDSDEPSSKKNPKEEEGTGILDKAFNTLANLIPGSDSKDADSKAVGLKASDSKASDSNAADSKAVGLKASDSNAADSNAVDSNAVDSTDVTDKSGGPKISPMDKALAAVASTQEGRSEMSGGFRYSSKPQKSKKRRKSRKSKGRGRKKSLTNKKRVKSHFTKTRRRR